MSRKYLVHTGEEECGPYTSTELKQYVAQGLITADMQIRPEGQADYVPITKVKGLFPEQPQAVPVPQTAAPAPATPVPTPEADPFAEFAVDATPVTPPAAVTVPTPDPAAQLAAVTAPAATTAPVARPARSGNGLIIGLSICGALMASALTGVAGYMVRDARPNTSRENEILKADRDDLEKKVEELKEEQAKLDKELESQQEQLDGAEGRVKQILDQEQELKRDRDRLEQEIDDLTALKEEIHEWRGADFAILNPGEGLAAVKVDSPTDLRLIRKTADPRRADLITKVMMRTRTPVIANDSRLAQQIVTIGRNGELIPDAAERGIRAHFQQHRFVPVGPDETPEYVAFWSIQENRQRVGIFRGITQESLTYFSLSGKEETIRRSDVLPGSVVKGPPERVLPAIDESHFLDYALLSIAHKLQPEKDAVRSITLQVRVDTPRDNTPRYSPTMVPGNGRGGLIDGGAFFANIGQMLFALKEHNEARIRAAKEMSLREAVATLEDEMYTRLSAVGVTVYDRERRNALIARFLGVPVEAVRLEEQGAELLSTHSLVLDVNHPQNGGRYHVALRLIDNIDGKVVWAGNADRVRPKRIGPRQFHLASGQLAVLRTKENNDAEFVGYENPPKVGLSGPNPSSSINRQLVYLESPANAEEIAYRPLYGGDLRFIDRDRLESVTVVRRFDDVPYDDLYRYIVCKTMRRASSLGGRLTEVDGDRVVVSIGSDGGLKQGQELRVLRYYGSDYKQVASLGDGARELLLPMRLVIDEVMPNSCTATLKRTGVEEYWGSGPSVVEGDLVIPDITPPSVVAVELPDLKPPSLIDQKRLQWHRKTRVALARYTRETQRAATELASALGDSFAGVSLPVVHPNEIRRVPGEKYALGGEIQPTNLQPMRYRVTLRLYKVDATRTADEIVETITFDVNDSQL